MNMKILDQDLVSHDETTIANSTTTFGSDISLKSVPDNAGLFDALVHFKTLPVGSAGSEIVTVNLYGGATAAPTDVVQTLYSGRVDALPRELNIGIQPGALKAFNRFGVVVATGGAATPGVATSAIVPKV